MEPGLLIASPQMRDSNFARSVVLLLQHNEEGALGLVINRETPLKVADVLSRLRVIGGTPPASAALWGGPVEPGAGFVVFGGEDTEGWSVVPGVGVSSSRERLASLQVRSERYLLCLGYSGWGPGQLDQEFETGSWVWVEATPALVFETALANRYDAALATLGVTAQSLWMYPVNE